MLDSHQHERFEHILGVTVNPTGRGADIAAQTLLDSRMVESEKGKQKRSGSRGAKRTLESAVRARHIIRGERNPAGWGDTRQPILAEDELRAKDRTRPLRAERLTDDIEQAYSRKRGATR